MFQFQRIAVLVLTAAILAGCTAPSAPKQDAISPNQTGAAGSAISEPVVEPVRQEGLPLPWNLILVNSENMLPEQMEPPELTQVCNGQAVDSRIYPALIGMLNDAEADGVLPIVCASFRTWEYQEGLYNELVEKNLRRGLSQNEAVMDAGTWIAIPGSSEHQTGLAVDIVDISYQCLDEEQEQTETQQWLMEHCANYGFILRYPPEKSDLTGICYEPWHYRYVGQEAAEEIMERGLCLEEYLAQPETGGSEAGS